MVINIAFEFALMIFGLIVFLIALNAFHRKMVEQKELEKSKICEQRMAIRNSVTNRKSKSAEKLLLIDMMERRLEKSHTWPFDKGVLNHVSTVLISVTAIMIARIIVVAVNL